VYDDAKDEQSQQIKTMITESGLKATITELTALDEPIVEQIINKITA